MGTYTVATAKMRSLGLALAALLAPALALGPLPFTRNALAFGVVPDVTLFKDALSDDKPAGNWTVKGGCVAASFSLSLKIPNKPDDPSSSMTLTLDPSSTGVDGVNVSLVGNCSTSSQGMGLTWRDKDILNPNNTLDRMISITFTKNGTGDSGTYGITSIAGMAEVVVNKTSKYVHFSGSYSKAHPQADTDAKAYSKANTKTHP